MTGLMRSSKDYTHAHAKSCRLRAGATLRRRRSCGHLLRRGEQRVGDLCALGRPQTDRVEVSVDRSVLALDALEERQYDLRGRDAV